jgi:dipeptidyl aminopeptidase/acylaminoacyl peptidase
MKQVLSFLTFILLFQIGYGQTAYKQKPLVNDTSYLSWTTVENGTISADGQYVYYRIANEPIGGNTWVILSTDKKWEVRSTSYSNLNFSLDSKYLYAMQGDSLVKLKLKSTEGTIIPHCKGYELYSYATKNWLIYTLDDVANSLIAEDLRTGLKRILDNVQEYSINREGGSIVCKIKSETPGMETMQWTDLSTGSSLIIYKGTPSKNLIYDPSGNHMAFNTANDKGQTEIRYYQRGWKLSKLIASDTSAGINNDLKITTDALFKFGEDGQDLFFYLTSKVTSVKKKKNGPSIWNYQDLYLLSEYRHLEDNLNRGENFSKLNISTGKVKQLLFNDQKIAFGSAYKRNMDVIIVQSSRGRLDELTWNKASHLSYYLCFTKTGDLVPIKENCKTWVYIMALSPDNEFLVYYDPELLQYLTYNIKSGKTYSISNSLTKELNSFHYVTRPGPGIMEATFGIMGWIEGTNKVIVHGTYDLWELDLHNKNAPKNITKGLGESNELIFANLKDRILNPNVTWLLSATNMLTKDGEIYSFNYKTGELIPLFKSATSFGGSPTDAIQILSKAEKANSYLLILGNTESSPNLVYTKDFKKLDTLSYIHPEKKYNWLISELATYKDPKGRICQGRLYKPENFNYSKKYPIIFYYYLESANGLNQPLSLRPSTIGINVPLLVSNDYVVCMPNIYLEANKPGDGALTSVLAAADYFKQFKWIDSTKMGILGHSRGGYETDYIVTHTSRFAAAVSGSGMSNLVAYYNTRNGRGGESNHNYVRFIMVMNGGLEDIPNLYNENSPILSSKNVSTPLLLMHNEEDYTVPVVQSTEFFVQLRSMQKPVWLLQYEGEAHDLSNVANQIDFQNKVKDFFDYYLKDKSLPNWMSNPITY